MPRVTEWVLDASALLALLQNAPGANRVAEALPTAVIGSVNLAEVAGKLLDKGIPHAIVRGVLESLDLDIRPFDETLAYATAALRRTTAAHGLSLGDRACLALAELLAVPALTTDRVWTAVRRKGLDIELIRQ